MSIFTASVHCHHSAMFFKMLGLQFGPAVLIEISLLNVASLRMHLVMFHLNFRYWGRVHVCSIATINLAIINDHYHCYEVV